MPNHTAVAIANEFLSRRDNDAWPQQMLIQKLVYIANGWNLAINNVPLITEKAEAWDNGPVYRSIWDHIKEFGYRGAKCQLLDQNKRLVSETLTLSETQVIDHVWRKYGHMTASQLSALTHQPNTPWSQAYFGRGRNAELKNEDIQKHYVELALAGRVAN